MSVTEIYEKMSELANQTDSKVIQHRALDSLGRWNNLDKITVTHNIEPVIITTPTQIISLKTAQNNEKQ
jgi:hypothetical protein